MKLDFKYIYIYMWEYIITYYQRGMHVKIDLDLKKYGEKDKSPSKHTPIYKKDTI